MPKIKLFTLTFALRKILILCAACLLYIATSACVIPGCGFAANPDPGQDQEIENVLDDGTISNFQSDQIPDNSPVANFRDDTPPMTQQEPTCAQKIFANALIATEDNVSKDAPDYIIKGWIYQNFQNVDVIKKVLQCPEVAALDDMETIQFPAIAYIFPNGREIVVNYMTQPKILRQRLLLASKRGLPNTCPQSANSNYTMPMTAIDGSCATARVGPDEAGTIWTNTEPAWYGIMVVQAGSMDKYVGEYKNNTIALKFLEDHLEDFYPHNYNDGGGLLALGGIITMPMCTSQSALADDGDIVNIAAHRTVGEDQSAFTGNDFYVAGDRNLQWITWAEVTADIVMTVGTMGAGTAVMGAMKGMRMMKTAKNLRGVISGMLKIEKVRDYEKSLQAIAKLEKSLEMAKKGEKIKSVLDFSKIEKVADAEKLIGGTDKAGDLGKSLTRWRNLESNLAKRKQNLELLKKQRSDAIEKTITQNKKLVTEAEKAAERMRLEKNAKNYNKSIGLAEDAVKRAEQEAGLAANSFKSEANAAKITGESSLDAKKIEEELNAARKSAEEIEKADKAGDVRKYKEANAEFQNLVKLRDTIKMRGIPQKGNVVARKAKPLDAAIKTAKALRAFNRANKTIDKANKVARASMRSGKIRDWLFMSTMKNVGALGKAEAVGGFLFGAVSFVKDFYDHSETATGEFTNNIEFKPLLLLSADNLEGQENVVSHGMWFMWAGDSANPADDDAAFLQTMDFAEKFYQDMEDVQDEIMENNTERETRVKNIAGKKSAADDDGQNTTGDKTKFGANNAARIAKAALTPAGGLHILQGRGRPAG
ncbi:MAG: hypothetical protein LBK26_02715, partial [Rickettsiales bacterium]|nr:hypothetical protein [Rickettsiales bacterium]